MNVRYRGNIDKLKGGSGGGLAHYANRDFSFAPCHPTRKIYRDNLCYVCFTKQNPIVRSKPGIHTEVSGWRSEQAEDWTQRREVSRMTVQQQFIFKTYKDLLSNRRLCKEEGLVNVIQTAETIIKQWERRNAK